MEIRPNQPPRDQPLRDVPLPGLYTLSTLAEAVDRAEAKQLVMHSSERCDWVTPSTLFLPLHHEFNFVCDVAAEEHNRKVGFYYGPDHAQPHLRDGLAQDWLSHAGFGRAVWMNPPYSRKQKMPLEPWLEKAVVESMKGLTVVGLIPANVQTRWWQTYVRSAYEVRFLTHRVSFDPPPGVKHASNAGHNVAVVVWKPVVRLGYVKFFEPHYCYAEYRGKND